MKNIFNTYKKNLLHIFVSNQDREENILYYIVMDGLIVTAEPEHITYIQNKLIELVKKSLH